MNDARPHPSYAPCPARLLGIQAHPELAPVEVAANASQLPRGWQCLHVTVVPTDVTLPVDLAMGWTTKDDGGW
jgi:hypothetical protein